LRPIRRLVTFEAVALIGVGNESPEDVPNEAEAGVRGGSGVGTSSTGLTRPPADFPNDNFHLDVFLGTPSWWGVVEVVGEVVGFSTGERSVWVDVDVERVGKGFGTGGVLINGVGMPYMLTGSKGTDRPLLLLP